MRLRKTSITVFFLVLVFAGGIAYLGTADLGRHREWIESVVASLSGRALSIEGEFHLTLGRYIDLSADRIRLANAPWGVRPDMLELDEVALQADLWSFFRKPVRIRSLSLGAARISLERNDRFQANWILTEPDPDLVAREVPMVLEQVDARQIVVSLYGPSMQHPVDINLDSVRIAEDRERLLNLVVNGRLGTHEVSINGVLGSVPALLSGRDLQFELQADSDLLRFRTSGGIASLKDLEQPDVRLAASGPDMATITSLLSLPTIAHGPFRATGAVTSHADTINLQLSADFGDLDAEVHLDASAPGQSPRWDLAARARGRNLGGVATFLGLPGLPEQPFRLSGRVRHDNDGTAIEKIQLEADSIHVFADGSLGGATGSHGSVLTVEATGQDVSAFGPLLGLKQMRPANFSLSGKVEDTKDGLMLESGALKIADGVMQFEGRLGSLPKLAGADLEFTLAVPNLASVASVAALDNLPALPVQGVGRIIERRGAFALDSLDLDLGVVTMSGHGPLVPATRAEKPRLTVTVKASSLAALGNKLGTAQLPPLPFEARLQAALGDNHDLALENIAATVGTARLTVNGVLSTPSHLFRSPVELSAQGPDLGLLLQNVPGAPRLQAPFELQAGVLATGAGTSVRKLDATIGDTVLSARGRVGRPPHFDGTVLNLRVRGKSLQSSLEAFGMQQAPDQDFEFSSHVRAGSTRVVLTSAYGRLGRQQIRGEMTLVPGDPNRLTLHADADTLDLAPLLAAARQPNEAPRAESAAARRVIPDAPLPMDWPEAWLAEADLQAKQLRLDSLTVNDFHLVGRLDPGQLKIQSATGSLYGGQIDGTLSLRKADDALQAEFDLKATDTRLTGGADAGLPAKQLPPADITIFLSGRGRSLHELAASANGRVQLVHGKGRVQNATGAGLLTSDLVLQVFRILNPFAKKEPFTTLQCGLTVVDVKDGMLTTDMALLQTDRLYIAGSGSVNLADETLDAVFRTQNRKGIGLSVSSIADSYLRITGTLARPKLKLNPKGAAVAGGAAAATGGLSILAESLWKRLKNRGDICGKELKKRGLRLPVAG